jgi:hypothetical protein
MVLSQETFSSKAMQASEESTRHRLIAWAVVCGEEKDEDVSAPDNFAKLTAY